MSFQIFLKRILEICSCERIMRIIHNRDLYESEYVFDYDLCDTYLYDSDTRGSDDTFHEYI